MNQDGINFNNYKTQSGMTVNIGQWPIVLAGQQGPDEDGGVINAVDIDWNGAQLSLPNELGLGTTITINTTGQLFRRL